MKRFISMFAGILIAAAAHEAHAGCVDESVGGCQLGNGCPGVRECSGGSWGVCEPVAGTKSCNVCGGAGTQQCDASGQIISECAPITACDPVAMTLYRQGPVGRPATFSLTHSDFDLRDDTFPNSGGVAVAGNSTGYRLNAGFTALMCHQPFYGVPCYEVTGDNTTWPLGALTTPASVEIYKNGQLTSINLMSYASTWPDDSDTVGLSEHVEGLAHSATHVFVSTVDSVYRVPFGADLENWWSALYDADVELPGANGHDHVGDIDVFNNHVFVPLEFKDNANTTPARLSVLTLDLQVALINDFPRDVQKKAGWVAVNPVNGLVYSTDDAAFIHVYELQPDGHPLRHLYDVTLDYAPAGGLGDGGAFSPSGHFYVSGKDNSGYMHLTMYELKGRNGTRKTQTVPVPWDGHVQGLDVFDAAGISGAHPGWDGQIHVALGSDWNMFWSMWHYDVDLPGSL
ncbi:MAG: hypothetical protein QM820_45340 [Minicystis sp.]